VDSRAAADGQGRPATLPNRWPFGPLNQDNPIKAAINERGFYVSTPSLRFHRSLAQPPLNLIYKSHLRLVFDPEL